MATFYSEVRSPTAGFDGFRSSNRPGNRLVPTLFNLVESKATTSAYPDAI